ncbi:DNA-binding transcriptional LysR family regulator [Paraburkholderia sp. GV068]|uniref:LysR family transcriptional regulator n=1 Tax=unclassified Paraburkholderia TaxID=2615204 RepID=UPI000D3155E6|nr:MULTISPECIES: LysR family transcriptional regulator [unclassified Paraburkholderia]PTQ96021.1 DNA-binding transcriptional LysR family regulator [Paraburkholderia sp. GV072]PUB02359.1 DNA-binding transcriptional LysR family regulator [Paraburkholderia sp. GV068]
MDRLEAMSILVAAAESGSFSAASRKLRMPLPTVSRKVAELEAHLNARLLVRSTRKLTLTDAGVAYLAACKQILEQVSEAESAAAGEYSAPRGELVVTAPVVFGRLHMLPVVSDFLAAFAEITVRLVLADRNLHLLDEHIDVALRIGKLPDSSMVATQVGTVGRVVCASPQYLAQAGEPQTPADLARFSCIVSDALPSSYVWEFGGHQAPQQTVPVRARLSVNTVEAAIDAAIAGVGLTNVLSYQAASAVSEGKLKLVLREFEPEPIPVSVMHAGQGKLPLKTRSFIDFIVPRLRAALARDKEMLLAKDLARGKHRRASPGR